MWGFRLRARAVLPLRFAVRDAVQRLANVTLDVFICHSFEPITARNASMKLTYAGRFTVLPNDIMLLL